MRAKQLATQCIECDKNKTLGLRRCRKCHFQKYGACTETLTSQPWWKKLELYIEGRIQMGIRQALKDAQLAELE